jgi:hypothetical protein
LRVRIRPPKAFYGATVNDERLTEKLAVEVMGWRVAPGRFIKAHRAWIPSWRFSPLKNLDDAFDLLDVSASAYTLATSAGGNFEAEVRLGERIGRASGEPKARTITIALSRALGLEVPDDRANGI